MVLCVGNHSSGKSSFINYVLQRDVQTSGVAPTDDNFTIIAPSASVDYDQDGFAIIGNPDYGFTSLQQFGPTLQHHTVFKLRKDINAQFMIGTSCLAACTLISDRIRYPSRNNEISHTPFSTQTRIYLRIVDSPGMIDAPASYAGMLINNNNARASSASVSASATSSGSTMDRGYDFCGVVKWYADRADVVLLFFDPDKPGTTGETLSILVNALSNIDHKLIIIFNKADQFQNQQIHDFARAYGSLCWNLSKVIPRKDLPRIYTMCLPVELTSSPSAANSMDDRKKKDDTASRAAIAPGLQDLYNAREEVVAQVRKAPERRLDNVITNVYESISQLYMYSRIVQDVQSRFNSYYWSCRYQEALLAAAGAACAVGCHMYVVPMLSLPLYCTGIVASIAMLSTTGTYYYNRYLLQLWEYQNCTSGELYNTFSRVYSTDIQNGNEHVAHIWMQIRDQLSMTLQPSLHFGKPHSHRSSRSGHLRTVGVIAKLSVVRDQDIQQLHDILNDEIPKLRRYVAATQSAH
jgi:GTPase SAR1 family protein